MAKRQSQSLLSHLPTPLSHADDRYHVRGTSMASRAVAPSSEASSRSLPLDRGNADRPLSGASPAAYASPLQTPVQDASPLSTALSAGVAVSADPEGCCRSRIDSTTLPRAEDQFAASGRREGARTEGQDQAGMAQRDGARGVRGEGSRMAGGEGACMARQDRAGVMERNEEVGMVVAGAWSCEAGEGADATSCDRVAGSSCRSHAITSPASQPRRVVARTRRPLTPSTVLLSHGFACSVLATLCFVNLIACATALSAQATASPPGSSNQPNLLPTSCFFALQACDFVFDNSLGFVPLYALASMQPDVPFTQGILHSKRAAPAISGKLKPQCKAVNAWRSKSLKCPQLTVVPPASSAFPSIRFAAKKPVSGTPGYSGACFTMNFSQLILKLGSGPKGILRLTSGDGNTQFPENRRCIVFRTL
ncbi:hypothetical protein CLOM_g18948 [Closterium sp. NIES-68]|nr:hypothetical protein CLOM_g18948 [Closterium sp. NIES-68]GJP62659.1 hypothetical protein CLOP_g19693 [Closterium sp. NIES-67]GJP68193.1 hypothetical protein CLOP_g24927 [Closterium sp. NIES-67]